MVVVTTEAWSGRCSGCSLRITTPSSLPAPKPLSLEKLQAKSTLKIKPSGIANFSQDLDPLNASLQVRLAKHSSPSQIQDKTSH
jgi:hypothetical protein